MTFKIGGSYDGEWHKDEMHGAGKLSHNERTVFNGLWDIGQKTAGKTYYKNGFSHDGPALEYEFANVGPKDFK